MSEVHTEPRHDRYDVVVVGSGLGGCTSAAFLAKAGKKVLLVERLDGPGGYAHSFQRGPYLFDPAVHAVGQCKPGGYLHTWLGVLGVQDLCTMIPLDPFYSVVLPGFKFTAPTGVEEFIAAHAALFPHQEQELRAFFGVCQRIKEEFDQVRPGLSLQEFEQSAAAFPTVIRHRSSTVGEVLDEYVTDTRLKTVLTAIWGYQGVPPSKLSFVSFAGMVISLLEGGQNYCKGSFQNLVNAWITALQRNNGELVLRQKVNRILVKDGRVTGVALASGRQIGAPVVVSNADATQTFEQLVGTEHLPDPYVRRLRRMAVTNSAFLVYAATTLDLHQFGFAHEIFKYNSWDHDENWRRLMAGEVMGSALTAPSLVDPSLAPPGEHILTIVALMPYDIGRPWAEVKDVYTEKVLLGAEEVFPGLRDRLTFVEGATPLALEKYSLNRGGAMYGWENNPHQTHSRRPSNKTPIEGLYLASAWAQPGSGTINAMYSGFQTAQIIEGYPDGKAFLRSLGG